MGVDYNNIIQKPIRYAKIYVCIYKDKLNSKLKLLKAGSTDKDGKFEITGLNKIKYIFFIMAESTYPNAEFIVKNILSSILNTIFVNKLILL